MRRYELATIALIALLAVQAIQSTDLSAQTEKFEVLSVMWGTYAAPTEVGPGDIGTLTVVLRTKNTIQSSSLTAHLELTKGLTSVNGESRVMTYIKYGGTSIPAGNILELQFKVRVRDDAALGHYTAKLVLEYVVEVLYYSRTYSEELHITIPVAGRPNLSLRNYNTSVFPGQRVQVLSLVNNGTATANNVSLEVSAQPSIYLNTSKIEVGKLPPGTELNIPVEVFIPPSLANSTITITSSVVYYGPFGVSYTSTFRNMVYVNQYERPVLNAFIGLNEVQSGSSLITNLTLTNYGGVAKDLIVRLAAQQPLQLCGVSLYTFNSIEPGASISIPVELCSIQTSVDSISALTVQVDYGDEYGMSGSKSFNLPIIMRALRDSPISAELINNELPGGVETELMLSISNAGDVQVKNVIVRPILPQSIILLTPLQARIESISPGSSLPVKFLIKTPSVESLTYVKVSFQLSYNDASGNYFSNTLDYAVAIKPQESYRALVIEMEPRRFEALSTGSLMLTLLSMEDVSNVAVSISWEGTPLMLSGSKDIIVGKLRAGEKQVVEVPYTVANKPGTYMLVLNVKYLDSVSVLRTATYVYAIEVAPVKTALEVSVTPTTVQSSSTATLLVRIKNSGHNLVKDLTLTVNPQGTVLTLLNASKYFVGDIGPGEVKNLNISLRVGYISSYTGAILSFTMTYYDVLNQLYSESYTTAVSVEPRTQVSVLEAALNTNELLIATINNVTMSLRNVGNEVIDGITYRITTGSGLNIIGANDGYIAELRPGDSVTLRIPIYVPLTNVYTSNLVVSFTYVDRGSGTLRSEDKIFTLLLRGRADLRVIDYVVMPTTVSVGQTLSVSLTLINVGVTPAYSTFVTPMLSGLPIRSVTEERTIYLGNIDVGSTTAATITLQLMNTSERMIRLPVVISYLDNLRTPQNVTFELVIRVGVLTNATQNTSPVSTGRGGGIPFTTVLVAAVAVIVVGVVAWKFMRRGR